MTAKSPTGIPRAKGIRATSLACAGIVLGMTGLSFAAVPLYRLLCQVTGFGGTPQIGAGPSSRTTDRTIFVRFDANIGAGSPWRFRPETPEIAAKLGETRTIFYRITNPATYPTTGIATFNVEPPQIGAYFVKIQCFCFAETTLQPGETIDAPVAFYIDPALDDAPELKGVSSITLSYTVFPAKDGVPVAATGVAATGVAATGKADKPKL